MMLSSIGLRIKRPKSYKYNSMIYRNNRYGYRYFYTLFKKDNPDIKLNYTLYLKICSEYNKKIRELLINKGITYTMPYKLGEINIRQYEPKIQYTRERIIRRTYRSINYYLTKKLRQEDKEARDKNLLVFYTNDETDGLKYVIRWYKGKIKNITMFAFRASLRTRSLLGKYLRNGNAINNVLK